MLSDGLKMLVLVIPVQNIEKEVKKEVEDAVAKAKVGWSVTLGFSTWSICLERGRFLVLIIDGTYSFQYYSRISLMVSAEKNFTRWGWGESRFQSEVLLPMHMVADILRHINKSWGCLMLAIWSHVKITSFLFCFTGKSSAWPIWAFQQCLRERIWCRGEHRVWIIS